METVAEIKRLPFFKMGKDCREELNKWQDIRSYSDMPEVKAVRIQAADSSFTLRPPIRHVLGDSIPRKITLNQFQYTSTCRWCPELQQYCDSLAGIG
jgi:hypothetical protein